MRKRLLQGVCMALVIAGVFGLIAAAGAERTHRAYLQGYPDGTIRPTEPVTRAQAEYLPWTPAVAIPAGTQILINATCVGFGADADKAPDICYDTVTPDMYVSDVVFNPTDPLFLQKARARGAKTLNGVGMMVQQGAINFTIWTGEEAPVDVMYEALSHELG